jgi:hypothetical protein
MAYLLGRGLRDLQLLRHAFAGRIARPSWRRGKTSLQASRRILNERYMRQARAAEPRSQLEVVLQCLLVVVLIGRVFNDNGAVSFVGFTTLLSLGLPFLWDLV